MKTLLQACTPRQAVLEGTADFVVNLADLTKLTEAEAGEFLDANVLTTGMALLLNQVFARLSGDGSANGIYKLSESMGGGKTQSMIVAGILARFPELASLIQSNKPIPKASPDVVAAFTGRATDKLIWVKLGEELGVDFPSDRAPSESEWRDALKDRAVLILLDEMAFYLVHAASQGSQEQGTRAATLTGIALTNLFGAVRDYKECKQSVIVIADLQKDWEQGAEALDRILKSNLMLGSTLQSVDNEMSKGAQTIAPVDNTKDELYAILAKRLFKKIDITQKEINQIADAYVAELKKASATIERPTMKIREEIQVSYPFHFSTKHLIASFNNNPGFQKTRDVIRLMAAIVRSIWSKPDHPANQHHYLLSLETADLNDSMVSSRFIEIKKSLQDALQTDIANNGTSHAESLDEETDGLASKCARWIYSASLSDIRPQGLSEAEIAEYLLSPNQSILGVREALRKLHDTCWYVELTKDGRYFFNRYKNLNAQVTSYAKACTHIDRDEKIQEKLKEMFKPGHKDCYQRLAVMPALDQVQLARDEITLIICKPDTDIQAFFKNEKYKNRMMFLTAVDQTGIFNVNKQAERLWAIDQIVDDLTPEDSFYKRAKKTQLEYEADLFIAIRAVFNRLCYPLVDEEGEPALVPTPLLDGYQDKDGRPVKYRSEEASKGEFVVESTLREAGKFQDLSPKPDADKARVYGPLRSRVETFLFPPTGKTSWEQIKDGAATNGYMIWTKPNTLERMREALITAGEWREAAGQIQKPPFEEVTGVNVEYSRDRETGKIIIEDIKLSHGDTLYCQKDGGEWEKINPEKPAVFESMSIFFKAVDSTGKNKEGQSYRIQNTIDIHHDFMDSATPGNKVVKLKVVPPDSKLLFTKDGSDPANNGAPYLQSGIEAPEGSSVRLYAEKGSVNKEMTIPIPVSDDKKAHAQIDPDKPLIVNAKRMKFTTRSQTYQFLSKLPEGASLLMVRAKVILASSDQSVTLTWDARTKLPPNRVMRAFEFLDQEIENGEWELSMRQIDFLTGKSFLDWQIAADTKISPELISQ